MRTRKILCVIAYDITSARRRRRICKCIEPYGRRINYSVFECMLTHTQIETIKKQIGEIVVKGEDSVVIYPLCLDCYARASYIPPLQADHQSAAIL